MKLSEIKETNNPVFAWIMKHAKSLHTQNVILNSIAYYDRKPEEVKSVTIMNATFSGTGEPFEPPPFDLHVVDELILNNYDFENSDYGQPGTIQAGYIILENCPKCDLVEVVQKTVNMQRKSLGVHAFPGEFTNLIPAADMSNRLSLRVIDPSTREEIFEIRTQSMKVYINGKSYDYSDVFDLQNILIDNGFEEYV